MSKVERKAKGSSGVDVKDEREDEPGRTGRGTEAEAKARAVEADGGLYGGGGSVEGVVNALNPARTGRRVGGGIPSNAFVVGFGGGERLSIGGGARVDDVAERPEVDRFDEPDDLRESLSPRRWNMLAMFSG